MGLAFTKALRAGIRSGRITCTVRIWQRCHVTVGGRYRMDAGAVEVTSITPLALSDITADMARRGGFKGLVELLKVAKHGPGRNAYYIEFRYHETQDAAAKRARTPARSSGGKRRIRISP